MALIAAKWQNRGWRNIDHTTYSGVISVFRYTKYHIFVVRHLYYNYIEKTAYSLSNVV